jgi:outer membrane lipoprotein-sorting protein
MGKKIYTVILHLIIALISIKAQEAVDIVRKANDLLRSNSSYGEFSMQIIKPDWQRTIRMKVWSLEPDYAMIYITEPAKDKGMVTLKMKKEVWNWIPAIQRIIKIPPSMMLQSWMGSDFTNDDLVRQSSIVQDYNHKILSEEAYENYLCYKIEMIPKPEAGVVWGKIITWISKKEFLQLRADYYDEDGYLVQTMTGSQIKKFDQRLIPAVWEMSPVDKPGQKTIFTYLDIQFDINIRSSFFSQQNMKRIR